MDLVAADRTLIGKEFHARGPVTVSLLRPARSLCCMLIQHRSAVGSSGPHSICFSFSALLLHQSGIPSPFGNWHSCLFFITYSVVFLKRTVSVRISEQLYSYILHSLLNFQSIAAYLTGTLVCIFLLVTNFFFIKL